MLAAYTAAHVLISLVAIATGFGVLYGFLTSKDFPGLTSVFLWTTILTSVTGFFFPFHGFTAAYAFGVISLVVLALAFRARKNNASRTFVINSVIALYLNFFVLVVQLFQKVPALKEIAPKQSEPPFAIAQGITLVFFLTAGYLAAKRFHPMPTSLAQSAGLSR